MKIAFIAPPSPFPLCDKLKSLIEADFPHIQVEYLLYDKFEDVPGLIDGRQEEFEAIVFGGQVAMVYANARLQRKTLWLQLPRAGSTILCALLNAVRMGWDVTKLSFDSYDDILLREIYQELGYDLGDRKFLTFRGDMMRSSYSEDVFRFHENNCRTQKATGCITGLYKVHTRLTEAKLPSLLLIPTRSVMREQLNFIQQFHRAKQDAKGQISVVLITIDFPSDHSVMRESGDLFILEKMKITQQVYRYAGQLQATVLEASLRDYLLFSTKEMIEIETQHYKHFNLLEWIERDTLYNVSIGIGHGDTVAISKSNAVTAMLRAKKHDRSTAYVCTGDGDFLGPFSNGSAPKKKIKIDDKLLNVAETTGISVNTIYKLHCFLLSNPKKNFTSQELAEGLAISKRSTDRILQTLEQKGFVNIIGKRIINESGRPSRLISIDLNGMHGVL